MNATTNLLATAKLTKKFLMSLPEGVYLVSNLRDTPGQPAFADMVAPLSEREQQWSSVKAACVDGRLCDVFRTKQDYEYFHKAFASRETDRKWPSAKSIALLEALLEESPKQTRAEQ